MGWVWCWGQRNSMEATRKSGGRAKTGTPVPAPLGRALAPAPGAGRGLLGSPISPPQSLFWPCCTCQTIGLGAALQAPSVQHKGKTGDVPVGQQLQVVGRGPGSAEGQSGGSLGKEQRGSCWAPSPSRVLSGPGRLEVGLAPASWPLGSSEAPAGSEGLKTNQ